ncbi:hypothetical protein CYMTET_42212 [Cymbomonas tetramitiformis]|uniref:RNA polymerase sigma-70 region 4 domain-containing protein n=1 Tax=Cymbomonas tetramitiformis TaxID=36881 RepID=A0AAE0F1G5_9CHLO|nr:hypothetical protein CYMTET_42212 [Cymbomonas tetramitiformis]
MVHSTTLPHAGEEYSSVSGMEMQTSLSGPNSYSSTCLAEVEQGLLKEGIQEVLRGTLTPREIRVLQLRYGLSGETACKVADVGVVLGLSRERTRQIEKEAIRKLIAQPGTDELRDAHLFFLFGRLLTTRVGKTLGLLVVAPPGAGGDRGGMHHRAAVLKRGDGGARAGSGMVTQGRAASRGCGVDSAGVPASPTPSGALAAGSGGDKVAPRQWAAVPMGGDGWCTCKRRR